MRRKTHDEYVDELKIKNPTVEVVEEYVDAKTKIMHHCLTHDVYWKMLPGNALQGNGCQECKKDKIHNAYVKNHEQYVKDVAQINPNIAVLGEYVNAKTPILHKCTIHDVEWHTTPDTILRGCGCRKCMLEKIKNKQVKSHSQYIQDVHDINPDILIVGKYINVITPILHKCLICGHEWYAVPNKILCGRGCPRCHESNGERHIRMWLTNHNIQYESEKTFDNCKDINLLPFDFYLPEYNTCIEFQGGQHYFPVELFGGQEKFELQIKHDKIKADYCNKNNIRLLCIRYDEDIDKLLTNFLFI